MIYNEKTARINALRQLLSNTDYQAIKRSEGMISDVEYEEMKTQRQAWRDEMNELEEKIEIE